MQSNFQSATAFFTKLTILRGVIVGPDGYFRGSFCPVANSLTFVPPTSITRTFGVFSVCFVFMAAPPVNEPMRCAASFDARRILEGRWQFSEGNSHGVLLRLKLKLRNWFHVSLIGAPQIADNPGAHVHSIANDSGACDFLQEYHVIGLGFILFDGKLHSRGIKVWADFQWSESRRRRFRDRGSRPVVN